jgi:hypothetical protein
MRRLLIAGLVVAVVFNLIVAGLYLWSHGGQTTVVEVEGIGGQYRTLVDGRPVFGGVTPDGQPQRYPLDAPESGTIMLAPPTPLSSFPKPSGIDSVVVLDPAGKQLFRDDFYFLDTDKWQIESGSFKVVDGVLEPTNITLENSIRLIGQGWQDYTLRVTYRNNRGGVIGTHVTDTGGAFYNFELFRDFPNFVDVLKDNVRTATVYGGFVHTSEAQSLRSIAEMTTQPYPYVLLLLSAAFVLALLLSFVESALAPRLARRLSRVRFRWSTAAVASAAAIAIAAFAISLVIEVHYYDRIPHVPDEVSYMFQAQLFTHVRIHAPIPPVREAFYFYAPPFLYEHGNVWSSSYPFGHPLVLALGAVFGLIWLVPPLVGGACVALTYAIGRRLYAARTGLLAALLFGASPFFFMQSGDFMSHNTGALYILASLFFVLKRDRPLLNGALAGVFFGLGVNTRLLNMAALTLPFGVLLLSYAIPKGDRAQAMKYLGAFVAGALLLLVAMLVYNYGITGDALKTPYSGIESDSANLIGFRNGHTLDIGLRNQQAQLMSLLIVLSGWPGFVGLGLLLLPFLLGTRNRWDYTLAAMALVQMGAYTLYRYSGVYEGPRYWYEAVPFLVLLTARGAELSVAGIAALVAQLRSRLRLPSYQPRFSAGLLVYGFVVALVVWGSGGWLFGWHAAQDSPNMPTRASEISGVFGVDDRLVTLAHDHPELHNALVLVQPCSFFASPHCYGSVFLRNGIGFDGDVVWARYITGTNAETVAAFPGRAVYVAAWDPVASLRPYDPAKDP